MPELERYAAWFTVDDAEGYGPLYYVGMAGRAAPPYKEQRHARAVLDIGADGTLAGIELIEDMPPPPLARIGASVEAPGAEVSDCFICGEPLRTGQLVLEDINEGLGHRACFGDNREGFVNLDTGKPIGPDEPVPTGFPYEAPALAHLSAEPVAWRYGATTPAAAHWRRPMADLAGLLERVKAATGPDRVLDEDLALCFGWSHEVNLEEDYECWRDDAGKARYLPKVTASVDAALALVERMLPGWACGFDAGPKTKIAFVDRHDFADRMFGARWTAEATTLPLAILAVVLTALMERFDG